MFDGIEVGGIRGKENKFTHRLVFNQGPDLFRMMDIAVVEDEDTSRARVGVG